MLVVKNVLIDIYINLRAKYLFSLYVKVARAEARAAPGPRQRGLGCEVNYSNSSVNF